MEKIADTLNAVGVPFDFHQGAGEICRRTFYFKDHTALELTNVLVAFLTK